MQLSMPVSRSRTKKHNRDRSVRDAIGIWLFQKHIYICRFYKPRFLTVKFITVAYDNTDKKMESIYSKRIRAGKRRTYFFDVKTTRANDYYLTITESRKRFNDNGYDRHKIFLYKEDFNKFIKALGEAVDYVKTELMPDFNFDAYNHDEVPSEQDGVESAEALTADTGIEAESQEPSPENNAPSSHEEVDKW